MKQNITADIYAGSKWLHSLDVDNYYINDHNIITIHTKKNTDVVTHMDNVILTKRPDNQKTNNWKEIVLWIMKNTI